ncbi:MAG: hypothetical protein A3B96_01295 [Candidatus Spechtbacteria bacterium RIFCSPHIGHO2_02_FULL_43_15b]|uniref:Methyltransferase type 11 domain-containing protein n=1 Tax=Candidatus Spechtbacteria bacterium RIFCSPHIGHO2_01_FULL_43_30 TaxID=1802158 RepID=A0A1G2H576_9BACT|nr:MAG: hypothetical protein A2827_03695 [Candidatus Spechtbacteria bacterium RIFCSPHIGHO2_01_FULL_43_30]OGZ59047.1 MAG: hypothetical protein A3B96_01295 [Candidatus Spechtbacteria bacterium RIFCSPHIGHO2_02_FULL_43_15b]
MLVELHKDKSIARIMLNWHIKKYCNNMRGRVVDLASGNASYYKYIENKDTLKIVRADYDKGVNPDVALDLNKKFPFLDGEIDNLMFFNGIYIVENAVQTLKECFRVLKTGGTLHLASPFIFNESREPHDYYRFTSEKLEQILKGAGFQYVEIIPIGERFSAASFLVGKFLFIPIFRFLLYSSAIFLDKLVPTKIKKLHPCPISYFCIARK